MLPVERLRHFIQQNNLFENPDRILLAVSGGKDSVLMVHLFKALKVEFGIAHCNFCLRGNESDGDELFVKQLAETVKVSFHSIRFNTESYAKKQSISIQMAARDLRYNWFEEIRTTFAYNHIALAHHQNDTIETVLLNLVRGTGISGLHGILPKRGNLIRPLLFLASQEIEEIIDFENILFREDSSNQSTKYSRNKIRHEVIPRLKEINPSLEETFIANGHRFSELEILLTDKVEQLREDLFIESGKGIYELGIDKLKNLKPLRLLLFELFKPFNFRENVLEDLIASWDGQPGKTFESHTHVILLDRQKLILTKKPDEVIDEVLLISGEEEAEWNNLMIKIKTVQIQELNIQTDKRYAFIDEDKVMFPVKVRSWKEGDFFYPFGLKGKKKISDFFTTQKIPLTSKKNIPILENGNGDIIWIAGYRTDERYKVSEHTIKVIIFELINNNGE